MWTGPGEDSHDTLTREHYSIPSVAHGCMRLDLRWNWEGASGQPAATMAKGIERRLRRFGTIYAPLLPKGCYYLRSTRLEFALQGL